MSEPETEYDYWLEGRDADLLARRLRGCRWATVEAWRDDRWQDASWMRPVLDGLASGKVYEITERQAETFMQSGTDSTVPARVLAASKRLARESPPADGLTSLTPNQQRAVDLLTAFGAATRWEASRLLATWAYTPGITTQDVMAILSAFETYRVTQIDWRNWRVGRFDPDGEWVPVSEHDTAREAAEQAANLNAILAGRPGAQHVIDLDEGRRASRRSNGRR